MLKVAVTVVQQIMIVSNGAVLEEAFTKIVLNLIDQMDSRIHRLFKVIAFNVNGIVRQLNEPSKQLQKETYTQM
jgi:hypothetical protein